MCLTQVMPEILEDLRKTKSFSHSLNILISISLGIAFMYGVTLLE